MHIAPDEFQVAFIYNTGYTTSTHTTNRPPVRTFVSPRYTHLITNAPRSHHQCTDLEELPMDSRSSAVSTSISLEELEAQITELAGQLNAANYRWLMLIAEFDRRAGWVDGKLHSCAHWLNFKVGLNLGAAREKVRVAHALAGLPRIAAAMARGELSYSKVRALSRVACPATEESLLMIALHGTAHHVERLVRGYRRAQGAADPVRVAARRCAHRRGGELPRRVRLRIDECRSLPGRRARGCRDPA